MILSAAEEDLANLAAGIVDRQVPAAGSAHRQAKIETDKVAATAASMFGDPVPHKLTPGDDGGGFDLDIRGVTLTITRASGSGFSPGLRQHRILA